MTEATFEKVEPSNRPLYGPRKLLLCGFSGSAQANFAKLLDLLGLAGIPRIWITVDRAKEQVGTLFGLEDGEGFGRASDLPRAIIMAGITRNEMHLLMSGCRRARMKPPLWATLTPVSETWTLDDLLKELASEHAAMSRRKR